METVCESAHPVAMLGYSRGSQPDGRRGDYCDAGLHWTPFMLSGEKGSCFKESSMN